MNKECDPFDLESTPDRNLQPRVQREAEDIRWLMASPKGRRCVWRLLESCGLFRLSYTGDHDTYFREGQRNVGLRVLSRLQEYCPAYTAALWEENYNDDRQHIDS